MITRDLRCAFSEVRKTDSRKCALKAQVENLFMQVTLVCQSRFASYVQRSVCVGGGGGVVACRCACVSVCCIMYVCMYV